MPSTVEIDGMTYYFLQWEDGFLFPTRTIDLTDDLTLAATYELRDGNGNGNGDDLTPLLILLAIFGGVLLIGGVAIKD